MRIQKHPITPPLAHFGALPAVTLALAAAGLVTTANAQLQTAGALLVNVDATSLPAGPLSSIPNTGTMGGIFEARGGGDMVPSVAPVYGTGTKGIFFDGNDYLQHAISAGGDLIPADPGITGANPSSSIEVWVLNPAIPGEETMVSWGHRGGPDGSNMSFNYGFDARWGAVGHWGSPDIGWDSCCDGIGGAPPGVPSAAVWHHLVYTYDGMVQKIYVDGAFKNSENVNLNIYPNPAILIGAQYDDDINVTGALRASSTIARVRVHQDALTAAQVANNYNFEKGDFTGAAAYVNTAPIHRYRFANTPGNAPDETVITDSIGAAHGTVQGAGATSTGSRVALPGGSNGGEGAYIDLPNRLLSRNSVDATPPGSGQITFEGWTKLTGVRNWARIFDIGRTTGESAGALPGELTGPGGGGEGRDYLFYAASEGTTATRHNVTIRNIQDPTGPEEGVGFETPNQGRDFHWAVTWDEVGGIFRVYENGNEVANRTVTAAQNRFSTIDDVNVWLGRSNWTGDGNMQGEFDEFRIYNKVLTAEEVARSAALGAAVLHLPGSAPVFEGQPSNVTVMDSFGGSPATFSAELRVQAPVSLQWYRNGAPIPGATGSSYSLLATTADNGAQFYLVANNGIGGDVTSQTAVLTVTPDTAPPVIVGTGSGPAYGLTDTLVGLRFNEPVNEADAETLANYSASGGITLANPVLQADGVTVLFTSSSTKGYGAKEITVNNIRDRASAQNVIAANSKYGIVYAEGSMRYEQYNGITGVNVADLVNNPKFPNQPDVIATKPAFEGPDSDGGNNFNDYGARMQGFLTAPVSGAYRFYLAADDGAALWISTDESPANKVQVAREPVWAMFRRYTGNDTDGSGQNRYAAPASAAAPSNISAPITLQAGARYYVEMIWKEGGGGDYSSVAWQTPASGPNPGVPANSSAPIGGLYLAPFNVAPTIAQDLADQTILDGRKAVLTVDIFGTSPITYQWYRNGSIIDGATGQSYTTDFLDLDTDNGTTFHVVAQNGLGTIQSRTATLTIIPDNDAPAFVSALGSANFDQVVVQLSEPADAGTATDPFTWEVVGLSVDEATLSADGLVVTLRTSMQAENTVYTVTASGLLDLAGNPLPAGASVTFKSWVTGGGGVLFESFLGIGGNLVSDLINHPNFPNNPSERFNISAFNSRLAYPDDSHEGYGARMRGLFIPPVSGQWIIYMAADDGSQLRFNPNGPNAAGAQILLTRDACCGDYNSANSQSAPMPLTAGTGYYIEMLYKEGGGGDWGQLAARRVGEGVPPTSEWILGPQLGVPSAPGGVGGELTVSTVANANVFEQTTYTFSVVASNPNGLPITYQWSRDGVPIAGATGPSYSALAALTDNGATFSVAVAMIGDKEISNTATLTVQPDVTAPTIVSVVGGSALDRIFVKYNELMAANAEDAFSYALTPNINLAGAKLLSDGMTVVLTLEAGALLAENTTYTLGVNGVTDRATNPNEIAPGTTASFSMTFAPQFLNFAAYHGTPTPTTAGQIPGNLVSDLVAHPSFPDDPNERFLITAFNSRLAYPNDSHEQYGARISGVFIPPTSGNWVFYMAADDGSQLLFNPAGLDPAGKQVLLTRDQCCGDYTGTVPNSQSAAQALTAGTRYYIEMIYKEGGGGDWGQVAARPEGQPIPPISEVIPGGQIGTFIPTAPAAITITQQPVDITYYIDPLSSGGGGSTLLSQDFNSTDGGFTATTPAAAFTGGFAYNSATGSWQVNASDAEISVPYTSRLQSPTLTVTKTGRARLTLVHRWSVEADFWDGVQARISVNGGAFSVVPAGAFTQGGYDGTVRAGNSIIQNQAAWVLTSAGHGAGTFVTSIAELGAFNAGDTIQIELLYGGDTNTKGPGLPSWEINSIAINEGGQDPVLRVAGTVDPNQTLYYQWQRNDGSGYIDVPGANGPSLTLSPALADNGALFRALVYVPGSYATSDAALLTVIQLNTPPRFNAGASPTVNEDAGPQMLPNWATDILPHSIGLLPANFSSPPPGGILGGNAAITGGILHLTDAINSQQSSYATPASPVPVDSFTLTFKARIGGGTCCGARTADGWSVSIGDIPIPVTFPIAAEEGAGMANGLAINFDSWDNGGLADDDQYTAPNVDVKVGGVVKAYQAFDGIREGGRAPSGPFITDPATGGPMSYQTGSGFTDVRIRVDADGTVDVDFKGVRVVDNVQTGLPFPLNNARIAFGARTGGANDNHWIDDVLILGYFDDALVVAYPPQNASAAEAGQTVSFIVENNNPSLFSAQPSIAPDGTLSYTPAPNANGVATVTVVAKDSGGVVGGGDDTSNPITFTITVNPVNDCPTAGTQSVAATTGVAKSITLIGADVDGDALQFAVTTAPAHGSLIVQPNGAATYQSAAGYEGPDSFRYSVSDGTCAAEGIVNINVVRPNTAPTAKIVATPLDDFSPSIANKVVISCDGTNGCLLLDGSLSSDQESPLSDLTFAWAIEPGLPFATGVSASICLELGTHTIGLTVKDPQGLEGHDSLTVEVISTGEAIEELINRVNDSVIERKNKRPFIASLKAAAASADRGNNNSMVGQLGAFQNKVRAQVGKNNPTEAAAWIRWAQSIIDAAGRCE